jgi:hypothetical protein
MTKSEIPGKKSRKYLGVLFEECNVYSRIYLNKDGSAYVGFCPKCARKIVLKVGEDGTDCRLFRSNVI